MENLKLSVGNVLFLVTTAFVSLAVGCLLGEHLFNAIIALVNLIM